MTPPQRILKRNSVNILQAVGTAELTAVSLFQAWYRNYGLLILCLVVKKKKETGLLSLQNWILTPTFWTSYTPAGVLQATETGLSQLKSNHDTALIRMRESNILYSPNYLIV